MNRNAPHFDLEAILQPFDGRESILEDYLNSIPAIAITIARPVKSISDFSSHLGTCAPDEHRFLVSGLKEAWEMSSEEGHEQLLAILRHAGRCQPELLALPAECLALKTLSNERELFESALSLDAVRKCDALELFKPNGQASLAADLNAATNHFRGEIAARCGEKYGSRRILLRRFEGPDVFTLGFYFEKPPKALRTLKGSEMAPQLSREEARPLQFDAMLFEPSTGILSVRSGYGRLTEHIRKAFATAFLGNPDIYEWTDAAHILQLSEFVAEGHHLTDADGEEPIISEIDYSPAQDEMKTRYKVTGKDVLRIISRDHTIERVQRSSIRRMVIKMASDQSNRRRRVVLTAPNKVEFKRGAEAPQIIAQLRDWHVLQTPSPAATAA